MADKTISALTSATTPLGGTEVLPIVQSSTTVKVAVNDLTVQNIRANATTGILQITGPAAASTRVVTVPDANWTAARTDAAQTFTGAVTANSFIPSSGSVPTNGVYLSAANTVAFATNSLLRFVINSSGGLVQNAPTSGTALTVVGVASNVVVDASGTQVAGRLTCYKVQNLDTTAGATTAITFFTGDDGVVGRTRALIESASGTANNGYLAFATRNAGSVAERMRIWGTGGVSIGNTTDPGATNLSVSGTISPQQASSAPTYVKGAIYFDTTLNKLRVGGATGWETITSV